MPTCGLWSNHQVSRCFCQSPSFSRIVLARPSSVDLLNQRFPVLHVGAAEEGGRAGDVELPVPRVHALDSIRHARGVLPDGADRQIGRVLAFPRTVGAGLGVEPVDQAGPLVDVDNAAVHGHDLGAAHAAVGVLPLDVALQIAGQQGFSGFRTGPAEIDLFAVGGAGERHAVIAAPVGGGSLSQCEQPPRNRVFQRVAEPVRVLLETRPAIPRGLRRDAAIQSCAANRGSPARTWHRTTGSGSSPARWWNPQATRDWDRFHSASRPSTDTSSGAGITATDSRTLRL
jgi:hypothetical protein